MTWFPGTSCRGPLQHSRKIQSPFNRSRVATKGNQELEERFIRDEVWPALDDTQRALLRSETSQPEVAQCEIGFFSSATTSCGRLKSEFEGCQGTAVPSQPGKQKLEQALLLIDCPGVVTDVLKQELEKARSASRRPRCRSRTMPQVVAELDAERSAEFQCPYRSERSLTTFGGGAATSLPEPSIPSFPLPECAEIVALKANFAEVEGERRCDPESVEEAASDHVFCDQYKCRSDDARDQSSQRVERVFAGVPRGVGASFGCGRRTRVMELSSHLSDGAAKMSELMGVMVP